MLSHVVGRDVALPHGGQTARLPPIAVLVVDNLQVLSLAETQVFAGPLVVVEQSDKDGTSWYVPFLLHGRRLRDREATLDVAAREEAVGRIDVRLEGGVVAARAVSRSAGSGCLLGVLRSAALHTPHAVSLLTVRPKLSTSELGSIFPLSLSSYCTDS